MLLKLVAVVFEMKSFSVWQHVTLKRAVTRWHTILDNFCAPTKSSTGVARVKKTPESTREFRRSFSHPQKYFHKFLHPSLFFRFFYSSNT